MIKHNLFFSYGLFIFVQDILSVGSLDVKGPINQLNLAFIIEDAVLKNSLETITVSGNFLHYQNFL